MALTPEQHKVLAHILLIGQQLRASPKQIKAAVETGLVESNLRNLPGGDADSAGWRQERASIYKDPTNLDASIRRFFGETGAVKGQYGTAGALAAAVQRPRAEYRGRYQQRSGEAASLLGQSASTAPGSPSASSPRTTTTTTTPGVDNSAGRAAAVSQFLGSKSASPVDFAMQIRALQDVPGKTTTKTTGGQTAPAKTAGTTALSRAKKIDAARLPYQWGGGHQAKVNLAQGAVPADCSGVVSEVLGINPRVASQFKSFGKPGAGGQVTIYAKDTHVLMAIRGHDGQMHFFGTSHTNPGGGGGWIPASALPPSYLQGFTARHI